MHLVAPLAAGVAGAENGIAEIYERGTTARAAYYNSFEGDTSPLFADVALDSHGGAVLYTSQLCRVIVKTSGGAILRDFTAGDADHSVEVRSESFTGTAYDSASSAVGLPTTLAEVLDRWTIFNGGTDWQVGVPGGGQLPISAALAGSYGLVFNAMAYGAVGDGVANDTDAIAAATAAAGSLGGIVYFPPGTYRTTGFGNTTVGHVSFIGAGPNATSLVLDNLAATTLLTLGTAPVTDRFSICANMRLSSAVLTGANMLRVRDGARYLLYNLFVDGTNCGTDAVVIFGTSTTELGIDNCTFVVPANDPAIDRSPNAALTKRLCIRDCKFITQAINGNEVVRATPLEISGCHFINTATTAGVVTCISTGNVSGDLRVIGCKFYNASGAAVTAIDFGTYDSTSRIHESNNIFGTTVTAYAYTATAAARGAQVSLLSRELRNIFITDNSAAPILPIDQYGLVVLSTTNAGLTTFAATKQPPDGARGTIVVAHPAAGTVLAGANFLNPVTTTTATGSAHVWEYRVCTPSATVRMALTVDGRSLGSTL